MMRRWFVFLGLAPRPVEPEMRDKILGFEKHWDVFVRQFFGCRPKGETTADTCKLALSRWDVGAFERSREAARKLFGL